jgi:hypothetical protein
VGEGAEAVAAVHAWLLAGSTPPLPGA